MHALADITQLLHRAEHGDDASLDAVFNALYPELRQLAAARLRGTGDMLSPTVLVNEFYLRLHDGGSLSLTSRRHFFAAAAKAMRWIIVDQARRRSASKRGGGMAEVTLTERLSGKSQGEEVLALHEALDALDAISPRRREIVELRYFGGFEFHEVAELLGCSERTAKREWAHARAFLHVWLAESV